MEPSDPIRVLVVDDDVVLAEALSLVLGRESDLSVVGFAHTGAEGVALAQREQPTVVLMDFHLPDTTGAEATRRLLEALPGAQVVMLTMDSTDETLLAALEAGAAGFLLKSRGVGGVVDVVRRAAAGEALFPGNVMARLVASMREKQRREAEKSGLVERLTARELEILRLMADGLDTKALAERLVVSSTTVRTHVQSILAKLGAHSRLEAVARASELGLIQR
jgi:DNA-binding NarL/FixJ family response regulator